MGLATSMTISVVCLITVTFFCDRFIDNAVFQRELLSANGISAHGRAGIAYLNKNIAVAGNVKLLSLWLGLAKIAYDVMYLIVTKWEKAKNKSLVTNINTNPCSETLDPAEGSGTQKAHAS